MVSIPTWKTINYLLILSFLRSGTKAKRGVEFRRKLGGKWAKGLTTICGIQRECEASKNKKIIIQT